MYPQISSLTVLHQDPYLYLFYLPMLLQSIKKRSWFLERSVFPFDSMVYSVSKTNAPAALHLLVNVVVVPVPIIVRRFLVFISGKNISSKNLCVNNLFDIVTNSMLLTAI